MSVVGAGELAGVGVGAGVWVFRGTRATSRNIKFESGASEDSCEDVLDEPSEEAAGSALRAFFTAKPCGGHDKPTLWNVIRFTLVTSSYLEQNISRTVENTNGRGTCNLSSRSSLNQIQARSLAR